MGIIAISFTLTPIFLIIGLLIYHEWLTLIIPLLWSILTIFIGISYYLNENRQNEKHLNLIAIILGALSIILCIFWLNYIAHMDWT